MSDFMPGAGVRLYLRIFEQTYGFLPEGARPSWRRSKLPGPDTAAGRYYAALDAINAGKRRLCTEPDCVAAPHQYASGDLLGAFP